MIKTRNLNKKSRQVSPSLSSTKRVCGQGFQHVQVITDG